MFADLGFNDRLIRSAYEFDQALEFDPKFWPLLDARLQVARKTGDSLKIKELELRLTQAVRR
jgi:hypothetical protein